MASPGAAGIMKVASPRAATGIREVASPGAAGIRKVATPGVTVPLW